MGNRNQKGRFTEKASLEDVLAVFHAIEGPPVVTSADVADETGISRESARQKLERLRDRDEVDRRETAGQVVLYWTVDTAGARTEQPLFADPGPENDIAASDLSEPADDAGERSKPADGDSMAGVEEGSPGAHPGGDAPRTGLQDAGPVGSDVDAVVEAVSAASWDDAPDRLDARKAAAKAVLQHALDTGDYIGKSDAVGRFREDYPVPDQKPETWWRNNARDVLQEVGEYSRGHGGYRVDADALEDYLRGEGGA